MTQKDRDLLDSLFKLEWQMRRFVLKQRMQHGVMGAPHQGQGRILALLKIKPDISQKELATILGIRSQSLGELLAKLEGRGYITRTPSETDRRGMDIHLTEAGRQAAEKDEEPDEMESFFDCLEEDEQAKLWDYLERLNKRLEDQLADAPDGRGPDFRSMGFRDRMPFGRGGFGPFDRGGFRSPFGDPPPDRPSDDEVA